MLNMWLGFRLAVSTFALSVPVQILFTLAAAAARVDGNKSQSFQAAAHMPVAYLIGLAFATRDDRAVRVVMAVGLSVLEIVCFLTSR